MNRSRFGTMLQFLLDSVWFGRRNLSLARSAAGIARLALSALGGLSSLRACYSANVFCSPFRRQLAELDH
jgi:hypothetical protein